MKVKVGVSILILSLIVSLGFSLKSNFATFEEKFCKELTADGITCSEVLLIDSQAGIAFFRAQDFLRYATLKEDLSVKEVGVAAMDLNELRSGNTSLFWQASGPILYGLATDEVHSVVIHDDKKDIQPRKVKLDENWLWYTVYNGEVPFPVLIDAYDIDGTLIYGKNI